MSKRRKGLPRQRTSLWLRRALVRRDGAICGVCGHAIRDMKELTIDHIVPRSQGGTDEVENLQPAHHFCNQTKEDMTPEEFAELQEGLATA